MIRTIPALIDANGQIRLLENVVFDTPRRAFVMILEEGDGAIADSALLSEAALATDWNRPEEDAAWSELKPAK